MFKFFRDAIVGVATVVTSPLWFPLYSLAIVGKVGKETVGKVSNG